ncbi:HlyD family efflux transporter periplasmic adaptor subunit [Streptacidiphilus rugosus]|uniref:HlyD family efflux transporter periplasmic adaptor subunit n=1 Tax=Streptacidiphilus rugosus TaxID=405783 RepID=UPI000563E8AA|nr:HlyD family efflux transporter periplasmic adaptor subunit [Streptacidiphilus rugosus]
MQFRQQALAKQQSADDLDVPAHLARPQGRLVLAVTAAVVAAACFWAVAGTVASKLSVPGVLIHAGGDYTLQSPVAGQVVAVFAGAGDTLAEGSPLLEVRPGQGQKVQTVRTVAAGRLTALAAGLGTVVETGSALATVERVSSPAEPLVAVLYTPAGTAASIPVGATVDVTVQSVPAQQYGVLRGRVLAVGTGPQTEQQITGFLGSAELGRQFSAEGEPVAVVVGLERSGRTRSGYVWSSTQGPPYPLRSEVLVSAAVQVATEHPVSWILP